jgi:hypothetical protein
LGIPPTEEELLVVPQLKLWDQLPLLPFMKICSFLDWKQVLRQLPLVCKHFNHLLTNEGSVGLNKLSLRNPSTAHLNKLKDKVSFCKCLSLKFCTHLDKETTAVLAELLDKFKISVVQVKCRVRDERDYPVITSFLNKCGRLRMLDISCHYDWDWSLHTVCPTLHTLVFHRETKKQDNVSLCNQDFLRVSGPEEFGFLGQSCEHDL